MTVAELRAMHPGPWRYVTGMPGAHGNVVVTDARGAMVPLFTILDWACHASQGLAEVQSPATPPV